MERVEEQAAEYNHSPKRELYYVLTHGLLHLLGYDHIEEDDKKRDACKRRRNTLDNLAIQERCDIMEKNWKKQGITESFNAAFEGLFEAIRSERHMKFSLFLHNNSSYIVIVFGTWKI
ncbi:MAG: rRNA maturation RNase YbeY [Fusobacterium varium]|nr:rRNA maturation RNase YbeY [Fusobacterium varium]UYI77944.1 MAG: rRNA maturation RNase YbeY [Fusobacterium varium]